jgi:hypothetical protein
VAGQEVRHQLMHCKVQAGIHSLHHLSQNNTSLSEVFRIRHSPLWYGATC